MNDIRRKNKTQSLPEHSSSESLANDFASFFKEKIEKVVDTFPTDDPLSTDENPAESIESKFANFKEVSIKETTRYVNQAPNKYCPEVNPSLQSFSKRI